MPYWFDGNNLVGQSAARLRSDRQTRQEFLAMLSSLHVARGGAFEVFFDGDDSDRARPPRGVRVRYSAPLSTDDAILQRLEAACNPSEVIVVTNDRSLARRCRDAGARTADWSQFTSRIKYQRRPLEGDQTVDLEEWARYFGIEDDLE
jgi:predicted RNA-binding protein with PIN domain